ncbi:MAG: hypothetical protein A6F71_10795 [Cycloclasticus sp. symbiont of Poecilosclerida sp. M]|nr:MAG: hypothetical protein A6F71_10795 [Cycloclasticus sp. symbiont of Poecilosclerida sp. M]
MREFSRDITRSREDFHRGITRMHGYNRGKVDMGCINAERFFTRTSTIGQPGPKQCWLTNNIQLQLAISIGCKVVKVVAFFMFARSLLNVYLAPA